jgi:hypothetical protein
MEEENLKDKIEKIVNKDFYFKSPEINISEEQRIEEIISKLENEGIWK